MLSQFLTEPNYQFRDAYNIHITEILEPSDPRWNSDEAKKAKRKELNDLIRRGTWKVVAYDELPEEPNVMTGGFDISIKNTEKDEPMFKAMFVIHGNRDREKIVPITPRPQSDMHLPGC